MFGIEMQLWSVNFQALNIWVYEQYRCYIDMLKHTIVLKNESLLSGIIIEK